MKAQFEAVYSQLKGLESNVRGSQGLLRSKFVILAHNICRFRFSSLCSPLGFEHLCALKELSHNKEIFISRPDKGSGVVILDRSD